MNSENMSSLRQHYMAQTRERILDAAMAALQKESLEALTIAQVAKDAGITDRTIYRHFQTREDLLKAVWGRMQSRVGLGGYPQTVEALLAAPGALFPRFAAQEGAVRASMYSAAGREVRASANLARHQSMQACVAEALPERIARARRILRMRARRDNQQRATNGGGRDGLRHIRGQKVPHHLETVSRSQEAIK